MIHNEEMLSNYTDEQILAIMALSKVLDYCKERGVVISGMQDELPYGLLLKAKQKGDLPIIGLIS